MFITLTLVNDRKVNIKPTAVEAVSDYGDGASVHCTGDVCFVIKETRELVIARILQELCGDEDE